MYITYMMFVCVCINAYTYRGRGTSQYHIYPGGPKTMESRVFWKRQIILVGIYHQQVQDAVVKHELRFPCGKGMIINPIEGVYRLTIWIPY